MDETTSIKMKCPHCGEPLNNYDWQIFKCKGNDDREHDVGMVACGNCHKILGGNILNA